MTKKIVIIEDEDNLGKLIKSHLEQHNYHAIHIRDGATGLETIRKESPDLVVMDLLLPRLHGFDILKIVHEDNRLNEIPLIVISAVYTSAIHKVEAKRLGVKEFVEKPLDFKKLLEKIGSLTGVESPQQPKKPDVMEEQLQNIQQYYADHLPAKIEALEKIWSAIQKNKKNFKQLSEFRRLNHQLIGSGTTFGFEKISLYARQLELLLDMIIVEGEETMETRKDEIEALLDKMRRHPIVAA
jgi:DNA-binding response OmpR family regulator